MAISLKNLSRFIRTASVAVALTGCVASCEDGYDLADEQPEWLSSTIYNYLQEQGNYTIMTRLIDDLKYTDMLARTGSKTLFAADDEAFARFFSKNDWGVRRYEDLSLAQKKMLLKGAMIDNACQVAYLSSTKGDNEPTEGDCMRRFTSYSPYDSVTVISPDKMPATPYWQWYRDNNKTIACFTDRSNRPMLHFIESFLNNNLISNRDCDFLFNYQSQRKPGDANINGVNIVEQNIKCFNGFIHKMGDVITSLPNMAEIINSKPVFSDYAHLLERFCAPYYVGKDSTNNYNELYGTSVDSVFEKLYFSLRSPRGKNGAGTPLETTPWGTPVNGQLTFDPGWNSYFTNSNADEDVALQKNMAVMCVPTNKALQDYWQNGAGRVLRDYYGTWDNVPDNVVCEMLNVNMQNSFVNTVPSKFENVLNDANDPIGIKPEDVDSVFMACNGAVFMTNKVFNPVAYISVSVPALINESMSIFDWAISQCGYKVYLNSQQSRYSLFIPTNEALRNYVDPCSYGKPQTQIIRFRYDATQPEEKRVKASYWNVNPITGQLDSLAVEPSPEEIKNKLAEILNTHIVIGDVEDGHEFYQTKGGTTLRVKSASLGASGMTVQGTSQIDSGSEVAVTRVYDQSVEGNGKTYIIDSEPIMTTRNSVADILASQPEYSEFYKLLAGSSLLANTYDVGTQTYACPSFNINVFNTFQYTVLVPTNDAIRDYFKSRNMPTWETIDRTADSYQADSLAIEDFLRYHIVDNSFIVGQQSKDDYFDTSAYAVEGGNMKYFKVKVERTPGGFSITDQNGAGTTRNVVTTDPRLYNRLAREWIYEDASVATASTIYTTSSAVVHQIDGVLTHE